MRSISLTDIRLGGPDLVAEIRDEVSGGPFVVANATEHADLEVLVLGLLQVQQHGKAFAHRAGPTFPQALSGLDPHPSLTVEQIRGGATQPRPGAIITRNTVFTVTTAS